ncbi:MAG: slipin family protein [Gammaproteobacteria bacterium]|nr:slipin family protein [Gammaproteobacteria bacterium]
MMNELMLTYLLPILLVVAFLAAALRILREYERGVVFFLGRFQAVKGPGLIVLVPGIQQMVRVDLRIITMDVPEQDLITKDNVTVRVNAVLYFKVVDAEKAVIQVEQFEMATSQLAQTTLRSVLGQHDLDELLSERDRLNSDIQGILDEQTDAWGIKVTNVEIKHVDLNENMIRAIARQAEAERNRRAKVIHADGEYQASERLRDAAGVIADHPEALQLRYLQTLADMSSDRATTVVFPLPMEWLQSFSRTPAAGGAGKKGAPEEEQEA